RYPVSFTATTHTPVLHSFPTRRSSDLKKFHDLLKRFLPRFERVSTLTQGGTVQFFLHEDDLKTPVPATRLSDGTIRFLAMSAVLDRKSTRLNSSHVSISYAVFCLKKTN